MRLAKVRRDLHRIVHWKLMVYIQLVPERRPLYIRHDVEEERVRFTRIEQRQNMRMLEVRGRLDLGQEPPGSYDRSESRLQHRARDLPLVLDVVGGDGFADAVETQGRLTDCDSAAGPEP